jgi:hypothetical protein
MSDIEKFMGGDALPERNRMLSPRLMAVERRREGRHTLQLNEVRRRAELEVANERRQLIGQVARLEHMARATTEAKYRLHRAKKETEILAGEDPELRAKFALLDDDLLQYMRLELFDR